MSQNRTPKAVYLVIVGDTIIYRHKNACLARTVQNACGAKGAEVVKSRVLWRRPFKAEVAAVR